MSNMAHCRFENTAIDLRDCEESMDDQDISEHEKSARIQIIKICKRIAEEYGDELNQRTKTQ